MAAWRDARSGETGDLWHRAIIDPTLLGVIGPVRGLRVLEIACGNGYLSRRFAAAGAREVVGIDASVPTIELARAREAADPRGVRFEVRDAARLNDLPSAGFDLVVANMALMDIADAGGTVREVGRVLDRTGRFVFSLSHPCFDTDDRSMWVVERAQTPGGDFADTIWRKVSGYREEVRRPIPWQVSETETVATDSYHRTLATYSRYLRDAGLVITRLEEPMPLPEAIEGSPQGRFIAAIPLHLVVEAEFGARDRPTPPA
jgi:SAM-dependent methyltransferase